MEEDNIEAEIGSLLAEIIDSIRTDSAENTSSVCEYNDTSIIIEYVKPCDNHVKMNNVEESKNQCDVSDEYAKIIDNSAHERNVSSTTLEKATNFLLDNLTNDCSV